MSHHGDLDTSGYTFLYVARWTEDKAVLKRNLEMIRQTADTIISEVIDSTLQQQNAA